MRNHTKTLHIAIKGTYYEHINNSVNPLYIIIGKAYGYTEEKIGIILLLLQINTKKYLKSMQDFGMKLNIRFKQQMVVNQENMGKVS